MADERLSVIVCRKKNCFVVDMSSCSGVHCSIETSKRIKQKRVMSWVLEICNNLAYIEINNDLVI